MTCVPVLVITVEMGEGFSFPMLISAAEWSTNKKKIQLIHWSLPKCKAHPSAG